MSPKKKPTNPAASVVATAHTGKGLVQAGRLRPGDVAFVEVRLDALRPDEQRVKAGLESIRVPVLLTARHPAEGASARLSLAERRSLLQEFLSKASAVDVELRSVALMSAVLEIARRRKIKRVLSFHDFRGTPSLPRLREVVRRGTRAGADVVKIATDLRGANDLAVLLLLQSTTKVPLATMGMGPLGKVSRLVLAAAGSRLNYGYLDKPQVSGQWPALELVERLEEVLP